MRGVLTSTASNTIEVHCFKKIISPLASFSLLVFFNESISLEKKENIIEARNMINNFFSNQPSLEFQSSNYQKLKHASCFYPKCDCNFI